MRWRGLNTTQATLAQVALKRSKCLAWKGDHTASVALAGDVHEPSLGLLVDVAQGSRQQLRRAQTDGLHEPQNESNPVPRRGGRLPLNEAQNLLHGDLAEGLGIQQRTFCGSLC